MRAETTPYLDAWTTGVLVVGLVTAIVCAFAGLRGRPPGVVTVGLTWLTQLAVLLLLGRYALLTVRGQDPVGPTWELWAYLVTVLMLPVLGAVWAREEHSRWSTFVLAVSAVVTAVMAARAAQIWAGVGLT